MTNVDDLQFFTRRELDTLQTEGSDTTFIDSIKVRISKKVEHASEWSYHYLVAENILSALSEIGHSCTSDGEWNWHVPRSPTNLYKLDEGRRYSTRLSYVAESAVVLRNLPSIYDRPRYELLSALSALGAGSDNPESIFDTLRYDIGIDMNDHYIRVRWSMKSRPGAFNNIYLHRGKGSNKNGQ